MLQVVLSASVLVAVTVVVHAAGLALLLSGAKRRRASAATRSWPIARTLIRLAWGLILIHLAEISVWGLFYWWRGCLPDAETAFYFSGVTYTTVGYGDLVLAKPWRLLAPVEGLIGVLMCGLSAGLFFAVVNRIYASQREEPPGERRLTTMLRPAFMLRRAPGKRRHSRGVSEDVVYVASFSEPRRAARARSSGSPSRRSRSRREPCPSRCPPAPRSADRAAS